MFFIKSENKRKNVMTSLVAVLLVAGCILLDNNLSEKSQVADRSCPEQVQVKQQQAGWLFGWHGTESGQRFRIFGISTFSRKTECETYQ